MIQSSRVMRGMSMHGSVCLERDAPTTVWSKMLQLRERSGFFPLTQSQITNIQSLLPPLASLRPLATLVPWRFNHVSERIGAARLHRPTGERTKNQDVRFKRRSGFFIFLPNDQWLLPNDFFILFFILFFSAFLCDLCALAVQPSSQNKKSRLLRSRDSLILKKKCSKEDSNLHGSPH